MNLHLCEIGATLPSEAPDAVPDPGLLQDEHNEWRDSSIDLQRGLEVVELPFDIDLCESKDGSALEPPVPSGR